MYFWEFIIAGSAIILSPCTLPLISIHLLHWLQESKFSVNFKQLFTQHITSLTLIIFGLWLNIVFTNQLSIIFGFTYRTTFSIVLGIVLLVELASQHFKSKAFTNKHIHRSIHMIICLLIGLMWQPCLGARTGTMFDQLGGTSVMLGSINLVLFGIGLTLSTLITKKLVLQLFGFAALKPKLMKLIKVGSTLLLGFVALLLITNHLGTYMNLFSFLGDIVLNLL